MEDNSPGQSNVEGYCDGSENAWKLLNATRKKYRAVFSYVNFIKIVNDQRKTFYNTYYFIRDMKNVREQMIFLIDFLIIIIAKNIFKFKQCFLFL